MWSQIEQSRVERRTFVTLAGLVTALLLVLALPGVVPTARADFAGRNGLLVFQRNGARQRSLSESSPTVVTLCQGFCWGSYLP
jgi:hypothetical protein